MWQDYECIKETRQPHVKKNGASPLFDQTEYHRQEVEAVDSPVVAWLEKKLLLTLRAAEEQGEGQGPPEDMIITSAAGEQETKASPYHIQNHMPKQLIVIETEKCLTSVFEKNK